jgi:hypothetical protein
MFHGFRQGIEEQSIGGRLFPSPRRAFPRISCRHSAPASVREPQYIQSSRMFAANCLHWISFQSVDLPLPCKFNLYLKIQSPNMILPVS